MAQSVGNAKNILVGASPLFLSTIDVNDSDYIENAEPGVAVAATSGNVAIPAFATNVSYTTSLNNVNQEMNDKGSTETNLPFFGVMLMIKNLY